MLVGYALPCPALPCPALPGLRGVASFPLQGSGAQAKLSEPKVCGFPSLQEACATGWSQLATKRGGPVSDVYVKRRVAWAFQVGTVVWAFQVGTVVDSNTCRCTSERK